MKDTVCIVLIVGFGIVAWLGIIPLELYCIDQIPPEFPSELTLEEWKASFQKGARIIAVAAVVASVLWYILARCFRVKKIKDAGKRFWWVMIALIPIVAIIAGVIVLEKTDSSLGLYLAYVFFGVNTVVCYYVPTLFLSPASFKYAPVGACATRQWW